MSGSIPTGRTYNQNHVPRPYTPGKRRFSIYWAWSYPWEANRDPSELDNRYSTMTAALLGPISRAKSGTG